MEGALGINEGVPSLSAEHMTSEGRFDFSTLRFVPRAFYREMLRGHIAPGDVLVVKDGATTGKVSFVDHDFPFEEAVINEHVFLCRTDREAVDPKYLFFYLWSPEGQVAIRANYNGAAIGGITQAFAEKTRLPLPTLAEQKRVAAILNDQMATIDRARAAAQTRLDAVQALPASFLRALFSSPTAKSWPRSRIGDVAKVQSGYAFKSEWFEATGIRLLRNANVSQGRLVWNEVVHLRLSHREEFKEFELSTGDIVLSLDRPVVNGGLKVARVNEVDVPALLLQRVGRFHVNGTVDPSYLYTFLNSEEFIAAITLHDQSLGVPHVSPGQVEAVGLPLPELAEQRNVVEELQDRLRAVNRVRETLEQEFAAVKALPAALLRSAFSGEL